MYTVQQSIRVGLFFVFGLLLIWTLHETLSGRDGAFSSSGYALEVVFDDLQQLTAGDEVRLAGIRVGQVGQAELVRGQARVTLQIDEAVKIPLGSLATITTAGLLGNNYIAIHPGEGPGFYAKGERLLTKKTMDLNAVVATFGDVGDKLAKAFDELSGTEGEPGLFKNLNHLLSDNRARLDNVIANLDDITTKVNLGQGTLGLLVNDHALYDQILEAAKGLQSLGALTTDARGLITDIQNGEGVLGVLVSDPVAATALKRTLSNLATFTDKLNSDKSTLGRLVTDDTLYLRAEQVLSKADNALGSMTDSAPLSALGVAATALF